MTHTVTTPARMPCGLPQPVPSRTVPLAAASAAAVAMAGARPQVAYDVVAATLLTGTTGLVLAVATLTPRAARRGQICGRE